MNMRLILPSPCLIPEVIVSRIHYLLHRESHRSSSPAILKGVLRPEVPVLQIALHLL